MSGFDRRIIAQWLDDPTEARLSVDARVEDGRIISHWDLFGAFDPDGLQARPFILRRDGRVDFSASEHWRTDLREAEIRIGATFRVWFNEADSGVYRIVKIAALGGKDRS